MVLPPLSQGTWLGASTGSAAIETNVLDPEDGAGAESNARALPTTRPQLTLRLELPVA